MQNRKNKNQQGFAVTEYVIVTVLMAGLVGSMLGMPINGEGESLATLFRNALETVYNTTTFVLSLP